MKTKLFLGSLLLFFFIVGKAAVTAEREIIDLKGNEKPLLRSLPVVPVRAFLENAAVILEFRYPCVSVGITIVNEDTGCVVYSNSVMNPDGFMVNLLGEESGNYRLEVTVDGKIYKGIFEII
ncbi:DUF3244 domain-containing protein [Bacteroides sp. 519]|uniref:DUF3244 domain-containing protein n=1 Tax=Bacteroides sp. 519 TaxID=2302937 RepID=UPI0013D71668|nr:DUF3244 domain-containing protein [Bacteroides sp. 519]NDV60763.1 DUF3244 domain-containing protein [Bacteroides sp. 519]